MSPNRPCWLELVQEKLYLSLTSCQTGNQVEEMLYGTVVPNNADQTLSLTQAQEPPLADRQLQHSSEQHAHCDG